MTEAYRIQNSNFKNAKKTSQAKAIGISCFGFESSPYLSNKLHTKTVKKSLESDYPHPKGVGFYVHLTTAGSGHVSRNGKSGSSLARQEVDSDRFHPVEQLLVHEESDALLFEDFIAFFRLVQSHTQGGPASPAGLDDPYRRWTAVLFEKFLDLFFCLF